MTLPLRLFVIAAKRARYVVPGAAFGSVRAIAYEREPTLVFPSMSHVSYATCRWLAALNTAKEASASSPPRELDHDVERLEGKAPQVAIPREVLHDAHDVDGPEGELQVVGRGARLGKAAAIGHDDVGALIGQFDDAGRREDPLEPLAITLQERGVETHLEGEVAVRSLRHERPRPGRLVIHLPVDDIRNGSRRRDLADLERGHRRRRVGTLGPDLVHDEPRAGIQSEDRAPR